MSYTPTKVGIIGCGKISETYAPNAKRFGVFDIVAIADSRVEAAQARAEEYGVPKGCFL